MEFLSNIKIHEHIEQLSKGQDETYHGRSISTDSNEPFHWIMLTDGHGTNCCINQLRKMRPVLNNYMSSENPIEAINTTIIDQGIGKYVSSGATCCIVKLFANRLECYHSGDSQIVVFKNGALVYLSEEHNLLNPSERQRILDRGLKLLPTSNIKLTSPSEMSQINTEYVVFPNGNRLACTQCLGHNGMSFPVPEKKVIPFSEEDDITAYLLSDGVTDMLLDEEYENLCGLLPKEIVDRAVARWKQEWKLTLLADPTTTFQQQYTEKIEFDDASCISIRLEGCKNINR